MSRRGKLILLGTGIAVLAGVALAFFQYFSWGHLSFEDAAIVLLGLLAFGGPIAAVLWYSQNDFRKRQLYTRQIRVGFQTVASQTGLRVVDVPPVEHPTTGPIAQAPMLKGTYRHRQLCVSYLTNSEYYMPAEGGDNSTPGFFRINISSLDDRGWPEFRRLDRGHYPDGLPNTAEGLLDQLRARTGPTVSIEELSLLPHELTCLARWSDYRRKVQIEGRAVKVIADPADLLALLNQLVDLAEAMPSESEI